MGTLKCQTQHLRKQINKTEKTMRKNSLNILKCELWKFLTLAPPTGRENMQPGKKGLTRPSSGPLLLTHYMRLCALVIAMLIAPSNSSHWPTWYSVEGAALHHAQQISQITCEGTNSCSTWTRLSLWWQWGTFAWTWTINCFGVFSVSNITTGCSDVLLSGPLQLPPLQRPYVSTRPFQLVQSSVAHLVFNC